MKFKRAPKKQEPPDTDTKPDTDDLIQRVADKTGHPWHQNIFERIPREDIVKLKQAGFSYNQIGEYYGICPSAVSRRLRYDSW